MNRRFLYYFMKSRSFRTQWQSRKGETDMADYVSLTAQRSFKVRLPEISEQQKIASILGVLDEKIDLNRKMNRTLQTAAQAIFRSWFVDFDPVIAKADGRKPFGMSEDVTALFPDRFVESELGPIPEGWEFGSLGDIAEQKRRSIHPSEVPPDYPYIGLGNMPQNQISLSEWGNAEEVSSNKSQFFEGEFLFGKLRPYFHKVGVALIDGICSTDILVIKEKAPEWRGFALGHLSSNELVAYATATSSGTRQPRTNWRTLSRYQVCLPPRLLAEAYTTILSPIIESFRGNVTESQTLADLRDILLPKLLSGEIRVDEAEKTVEEAV